MKYVLKDIRARKIARTHELVDLWMECNVPAQFWLQQPIKIPDATKTELRALKLHWFRMCHPILYPILWILGLCLFICPSIIFNIPLAFLVGICVYFIVVICHMSLHHDMMSTIKWYEDGKPIDY